MEPKQLGQLSADLLVRILQTVDGPSLASAACACTALRGAAKEDALWEKLCHGAWPSTTESTARKLVSSLPGGFAKFYADSLPLLLYKPCRQTGIGYQDGMETSSNPLDLVSFVDVYYKNKCVLSRVVLGVPLYDPETSFLESPFKVDALGELAVNSGGQEKGEIFPSISLEPKEEGGVGVLSWALEEDLTLTWLLLDIGRGRAVNISSGRPTVVQRDWPAKGDLVVRFGCPVPVEKQLLACGVAECVISVRGRLPEAAEDRLICIRIELQVEEGEGVLVDWRRSVVVLQRALCYKKRTRNCALVEEGYRAYVKDRRMMREKGIESRLAGRLCALCGVVLLVCFGLPLL